ncbi:MAG: ribonuclease T2 [Pseudomonadota bacterium]
MRRLLALLVLIVLSPVASAQDRPGDFSHYVMALSWNPAWCAAEGDARDADQCEARHDHGWLLHGLWPQREDGWPEYCHTTARNPSRAMTAGMADIMGSSGLAWYQWKKHGRCSGLSARGYFDLARKAYDSITRPQVLRKVTEEISLPPTVVEDAFLDANPSLKPAQMSVKCRDGMISEVRICLTKDLELRNCDPITARACSAEAIEFPPIR